jgi:predicted Zn-dependent protease
MSGANLSEVAARATDRLRAAGVAGDVILADGNSHEVRVRGDEIDFVKQSHERCLGIRALVSGEGGTSSATTSTSGRFR